MATFTARELVELAMGVGLPLEAAKTAAAYAIAESGGNEAAIHHNRNGSTDYGLWQINDKAHPDYRPADMLQAGRNAAAMRAISKNGTDWSAWKADQGTQRLAAASAQVAVETSVNFDGKTNISSKVSGALGAAGQFAAGFANGAAQGAADAAGFGLGVARSLVLNGLDFSGILDSVQGIVLAAVFVAGGIALALWGVSKLGGINTPSASDAIQVATTLATA